MRDPTLILRDIHPGTAPAWWPPAPGWWGVAAVLAAALVAYLWWRKRKQLRLQRMAELFDRSVPEMEPPVGQVAAMSELLRRCARQRDPQADRFQGDAWLAFLDGTDMLQAFTHGVGRLLLEGGFRREADPREVAALRALARQRFVAWMVR
ncbi:DUF4381 domain-containing protein [Lysobacter tyrosinilyticus]